MEAINNTQNVIDSRDIIERIKELESLENDRDELETLQKLAEEAASANWEYGEVLIRETYFEEYAQELAEDIGAINRDSNWPNNCIDWKQAARELQMDYTPVDFDGIDYFIRD